MAGKAKRPRPPITRQPRPPTQRPRPPTQQSQRHIHVGETTTEIEPPPLPTQPHTSSGLATNPTEHRTADDTEEQNVSKKKGRGPTRNFKLLKLPTGVKLPMEFNANGESIGIHTSAFSNYCGWLVRMPENANPCVPSWCGTRDVPGVPEGQKEKLWKLVCDKFEIDKLDEMVKWNTMKMFGKKFNDNRCDIKREYYTPNAADPERLAKEKPPGYSEDQWKYMIQHFASEEHQLKCDRNKENRDKQVALHASGSVSHARVLEKITEENNGVPPSDYEHYRKVHIGKDGTPSDTVADDIMSQVDEWIARDESEGLISDVDHIFVKVRDQMKVPTKYTRRPRFNMASGRSEMMEYKKVVENLQAENSSLQERLKVSEENFKVLNDKVDSLFNARHSPLIDSDETEDPYDDRSVPGSGARNP